MRIPRTETKSDALDARETLEDMNLHDSDSLLRLLLLRSIDLASGMALA